MGFSRKTKLKRRRTIKKRGSGMWKTSTPKNRNSSKSKSRRGSVKGIDMVYHQFMVMPAVARAKGLSKTRASR